MLESVLANYESIVQVQVKEQYPDLTLLRRDEIPIVKDLIAILQPFLLITEEMSGKSLKCKKRLNFCIKFLIH